VPITAWPELEEHTALFDFFHPESLGQHIRLIHDCSVCHNRLQVGIDVVQEYRHFGFLDESVYLMFRVKYRLDLSIFNFTQNCHFRRNIFILKVNFDISVYWFVENLECCFLGTYNNFVVLLVSFRILREVETIQPLC